MWQKNMLPAVFINHFAYHAFLLRGFTHIMGKCYHNRMIGILKLLP